jgi:hypothetical protein
VQKLPRISFGPWEYATLRLAFSSAGTKIEKSKKCRLSELPVRDHWGLVQTVFFAGRGVRGGTVVGSSAKIGGYPHTDPQTPENLAATICDVLGLPPTAAFHDPANRPHFIYHGKPIAALM